MSAISTSSPARRPTGRAPRVLQALFLCALFCLSLLVAGCGRGSGDGVLANVGDRKVLASYYEEKLGKLEAKDLPRDAQGQPLNTSTLEGKKAFLDVIINKELMVAKAIQLGYDREEQITGATTAMIEYQAGQLLHKDLIEGPAGQVSEQELADYYNNLGEVRTCSFLICNFLEDARKARQAIIEGGLWEDVAEEYHDGSLGPKGDYRVDVAWGRYEDNFEQAVFGLKEGEVGQPAETIYGYWLLRLEGVKEDRVPPLEEIKEKILNSIRMRKINLSRKKFLTESRAKHGFELSENALWIIYQGLPEGEQLLDPETRKPIPRSELKPLDVPLEELDRLFHKVTLGGKVKTLTVGDYKVAFDQMNTFQRPKKTDMLGGVRQKILEEIDRQLIVQEARERGYFEDPRVTGQVAGRSEEMMVSKLHTDLVKYEEYVSPEALDQFWAEHKQEYFVPERRDGLVAFCLDKETAGQARAAALAGTPWEEILDRYDADEQNQERKGQLDPIREDLDFPLRDALFSLKNKGDLSEPFEIAGKWGVVSLGNIEPAFQQELADVRDALGQRIRLRRQDEALRNLLAEWRQEFGVTVHEDRLARLRSWDELTSADESIQ